MMRSSLPPLVVATLGCLPLAGSAATLLEITGGYDVLVEGDMSLNGVHMHGATGVGGNLTLTGNQTEFFLDKPARPSALTVGGSVTLDANGNVLSPGKLHVGSLTSGQSIGEKHAGNPDILALKSASGRDLVFQGGQTAAQANTLPANFDVAGSFNVLRGLSSSLAGMSQTLDFNDYLSGDANNLAFNLQLGLGGGFDVMNITGAQLASLKTLNFSHLAGFDQQLVINVDLSGYHGGTIVQNRNGEPEADNILWNFYGADSLTLENQFIGSILAPDLALTHNNNDLKGSVVAQSFTKNGGQVHVHDFAFPTPDPSPQGSPVPDGGSSGFLALLAAPLFGWFKRRAA